MQVMDVIIKISMCNDLGYYFRKVTVWIHKHVVENKFFAHKIFAFVHISASVYRHVVLKEQGQRFLCNFQEHNTSSPALTIAEAQ